MLKLEKGLEGIYIKVREKDKFFNSLLLKALAAALLFHILFFVVFQIQPFKMSSSFLFPPVMVQTDQNGSTLIQKEHEDEISLLPPPPYAIDYPKQLPQGLQERPQIKGIPPFNSEDQILLTFTPATIERPKVQLSISGEPSTLQWLLPDALKQKIEVPINKDPLFVKFLVLLDENRGEVFWYDKIQGSGSSSVDKTAEEVLLNLHFHGEASLNMSGIIDFAIYSEENS
jgi:hypothetical protein